MHDPALHATRAEHRELQVHVQASAGTTIGNRADPSGRSLRPRPSATTWSRGSTGQSLRSRCRPPPVPSGRRSCGGRAWRTRERGRTRPRLRRLSQFGGGRELCSRIVGWSSQRSQKSPGPPAESRATVYPDMWLDPDDDPRETGAHNHGRAQHVARLLCAATGLTLQIKCDDLDAAQLASRSVPPSTMSLLGLVRHMAEVERAWFRRVDGLRGRATAVLRRRRSGRRLRRRCRRSGRRGGAPGRGGARRWRSPSSSSTPPPTCRRTGTHRDGTVLQLRDILVRMIEEYARHCGHADLLRERIDGRSRSVRVSVRHSSPCHAG